jgi:hypothetical protein
MNSSLEFLHNGIILDACCVINLYASGQIRSILTAIPKSVAVAAYVRKREALYIYSRSLGAKDMSSPKEKIDLQPLIDDNLLTHRRSILRSHCKISKLGRSFRRQRRDSIF